MGGGGGGGEDDEIGIQQECLFSSSPSINNANSSTFNNISREAQI